MGRKLNVEAAYNRIYRAFERIATDREKINELLLAKFDDQVYDGVYLDHNMSDGIIIVHSDDQNTCVDAIALEVILSDKVTAEEAMEWLKDNSI